METSEMASVMAMSREGHLEQILHMFAYLRIKHKRLMVFDPTEPDINESQFFYEDQLASSYGEYKGELPLNDPQPKGIGFTMRAFVDSDHADELTTR